MPVAVSPIDLQGKESLRTGCAVLGPSMVTFNPSLLTQTFLASPGTKPSRFGGDRASPFMRSGCLHRAPCPMAYQIERRAGLPFGPFPPT